MGPLATLPLLQIAIWTSVALLLVGTVVTLRSRWANRRPMRRCVLLSTAAHLLLIALAASVRFASVPPGDGLSKPVRVSLVAPLPRSDQVQAASPIEPMELVREPDQDGAPTVEAEPVEVQPEPAAEPKPSSQEQQELPEPPPLLETPTTATPPSQPVPSEIPPTQGESAAAVEPQQDPPAESEAPVETPVTESTEPVQGSVIVREEPLAEPIVAETPSASATTPADEPPPTSQNPPQPLADRARPDRLVSVIEQGGSRETEQAVAEALEWLSYAQSKDGRWDANRWEGGREMYVHNHDRGGAGRNADTGITGLALLTFLGAGHSHLEGGYRSTVTEGLNFLLQSQGTDGNLAGESTKYARTYCHSMATFALAEAYALTGDQRLEPAVRRGTDFLVRTQHLASGGWRYHPAQAGDVSQLGWVVMALRSAELGGIEVPDQTWRGTERFLALVTRGQHGGLACYQPQSPVTASMTAEALYCRQVLGKPPVGLGLDEGVGLIMAEPPGRGEANLYYWYYATLALHKAQHDTSASAAAWHDWNDHLKRSLIANQVNDGSNRGSWSPNTVWGGYGGRVYSTSMAAMCLEVYYRYGSPKDGEIPWMAGRARGGTNR